MNNSTQTFAGTVAPSASTVLIAAGHAKRYNVDHAFLSRLGVSSQASLDIGGTANLATSTVTELAYGAGLLVDYGEELKVTNGAGLGEVVAYSVTVTEQAGAKVDRGFDGTPD